MQVVLAPNPGPMTLDGTNTYVLAAPGSTRAVVVDPGPDDPAHLQAVTAAARAAGRHVAMIVLTHSHADHSEGAPSLARLTGAPVRAVDPGFRLGDEGLPEGAVVDVDGLELRVLATPGHTGDSVSLVLRADAATPGTADCVLTGDTVLGRGTTVVAHPHGVLADYLASLRRLRELGPMTVRPGHGPALPDAGAAAEAYLRHRGERLDQVRAALAAGDATAPEVVQRVYADVDPALWPAAELSVLAQLLYLRRGGGPP